MSFCRYCGRQLAEGEVCGCTARQQDAGYGGYSGDTGAQSAAGYQQDGLGYQFEDTEYHETAEDNQQESSGYQQEGSGYQQEEAKVKKGGSEKKQKLDEETVNEKKDELFAKLTRSDVINTYERGKKIVPDCIKANDGEIPIKQYNFAVLRTRLSFEKAEGRLQVTNKRLLFRATGRSLMGRTELHEEFKVSEIAGIDIRNRYVLSLFKVITSLLLSAFFFFLGFIVPTWILGKADSEVLSTIYGVLSMLWSVFIFIAVIVASVIITHFRYYNKFYWLKQIFVANALGGLFANVGLGVVGMIRRFSIFTGMQREGIDPRIYFIFIIPLSIMFLVILFLMCFVPDLVVSIKTKGSLPAVFVSREKGSALTSFLGGGASNNCGFREVGPWKDTDKAIKELGTLIDDINTLGDAAIEKWRE